MPENRVIESAEYLTPEQIPGNPASKFSIVDVKCKDSMGRHFIVELQSYWNSAFFMRSLYNAAKVYSSQPKKSYSFSKLRKVYSLAIVNVEKGRAEAREEKLASALAIYKSGQMPLEQIAAIMKLDAG